MNIRIWSEIWRYQEIPDKIIQILTNPDSNYFKSLFWERKFTEILSRVLSRVLSKFSHFCVTLEKIFNW